jgi:hypothetical protein
MSVSKLRQEIHAEPPECPNGQPETLTPADPFDLAWLRRAPDVLSTQSPKQLLHIPVNRPNKQEYFRVHPEHQLTTSLIYLEGDREYYLVDPTLWEALETEAKTYTIFLVVTRSGGTQLWPVRLPDPDGKHNGWHATALVAAERAKTTWVRLQPNQASGGYDLLTATQLGLNPVWPDMSFQDIIRLAFKQRLIDTCEHPVIKQLLGHA